MKKEKQDLESKEKSMIPNPKIEIAYDFEQPLDFSLYKITSIYEEEQTTEDIKMDFDKIEKYRAQIIKYFKNINKELMKIITKLTKLKTVVKDQNKIELIIKSCKKKIAFNENKILKLQESINLDIKDIIILGQKKQQELIKKVTELEQLMAAQIIFNNNISNKIQEQTNNKS